MTTKTTASIPAPVWCEIAVADIATDGTNPRTLFDTDGDAGLADLAASIKAQGLLQPVIVRADADAQEGQPPYLLVAGERRLRATRDVLKRPTIAALLRYDLTEDTALEATVLENLQRRDLHPLEEARGLAQLRARPGYTAEHIAKKIGRRKEWVKDRLTLCDLPATAQDLYLRDTTGRLTLTKMLKLHEYTHGNKDNTGFPRLIEAMAEDIVKGINPDAHPSTTASLHAGLVKRLTHWHTAQGGRYGGNYFDTYNVCRKCPFAAYRSPYGDDEGFCLMPDHYAALQAKGKAAYEEVEAARQQDAPAALSGAAPSGSSGYTPPDRTDGGAEGQGNTHAPPRPEGRLHAQCPGRAPRRGPDRQRRGPRPGDPGRVHPRTRQPAQGGLGRDRAPARRGRGHAHARRGKRTPARGAHHGAAHARPARPRQGDGGGAAAPAGASGPRL